MGREVAARARVHRHDERHRHRQRPHRVGLRLLLEGDGQHAVVHARLHQRGRDDRRRAADRAGRVHAQQRLADGAERLGEVQLGHHHALEQVGRLADDDGVDVGEGELRVLERAVDGLAQQARRSRRPRAWPGGGSGRRPGRLRAPCRPSGSVPPSRTRGSAAAPARRSRGRARAATRPAQMRRAASPMRTSPEANIGLRASAPPDGLTVTSSPSPSSRRRISSWWEKGACSSAVSTPAAPAASPASAGAGGAGQVAGAERAAGRCGARSR